MLWQQLKLTLRRLHDAAILIVVRMISGRLRRRRDVQELHG